MEWQRLALLDKQGIFPALPAEFSPEMIAGEKWRGLVEDFWSEPAERYDLAVTLCTSGFEETHCHFAGALLRVLSGAFSGGNLWR